MVLALAPATLWEHAQYTVDHAVVTEEKELAGALLKLSAETKQEAIRGHLGHPSPTTLTEILVKHRSSICVRGQGVVVLFSHVLRADRLGFGQSPS